jgi:hypothetical protein
MVSPRAWSYGDYDGNYGAHTMAFQDAQGITYWFSYNTLIAFSSAATGGRVVHTNDWSPTTGKHLNWIDGGDKESRVGDEEFKHLLEKAMA